MRAATKGISARTGPGRGLVRVKTEVASIAVLLIRARIIPGAAQSTMHISFRSAFAARMSALEEVRLSGGA